MFGWMQLWRCFNWITVQKTIACTIQKRLTGLAAEMAFHAMLGLFPAIMAVLTAISLFEESVESTFVSLTLYLAGVIPTQIWTLLLEFVANIKSADSKSWLSFSSVAAVWIISGVLSAAMNALEQIHQISEEARRSYLQTKIIALSLTVLTILLLIIACFLLWVGDFLLQIALKYSWDSLLLTTWKVFSIIVAIAIATTTIGIVYQFQTKLSRKKDRKFKLTAIGISILISVVSIQLVYSGFLWLKQLIIASNLGTTLSELLIDLWRLLGFPIALGIIAIAFSLIYRYGSSHRHQNTPIFPGAILAAISWAIVSLLFRFYVAHIGIYSKIYGAIGTAIILMLWLYLSSLVMLIGEQINVVIGEQINDSSGSKK